MTSLRQVLTCAALASLSAFLIALTAATCTIATIAQQIPKHLDAAIIETRAQVLGRIADLEHDLFKRVDQIAERADGRLGSIQADLNSQLTRTVDAADSQLTRTLARVDGTLGEIHELRTSVGPVIENAAQLTAHAGSVAKQVDDSLPLYLDCEGNPSCMYNRVQGTSKAVERAAQNFGAMSVDIRASVPQQLAAVEKLEQHAAGIAADVHTVTSEYTKPVGFWRKLWGAAKTGAILYVRTL